MAFPALAAIPALLAKLGIGGATKVAAGQGARMAAGNAFKAG